jgi:hypothetical protein
VISAIRVRLHVTAHLDLIVLNKGTDHGRELKGTGPKGPQWQADLSKNGLQDHKEKALENRFKLVGFNINDFNSVHAQCDGILTRRRHDVFKMPNCKHLELATRYLFKWMTIVPWLLVLSVTGRFPARGPRINSQTAAIETQFNIEPRAELTRTQTKLGWQRH